MKESEVICNRYRVESVLAQSGSKGTYLGTDLERLDSVVLKAMPKVSVRPEVWRQIEKEARRVGQIRAVGEMARGLSGDTRPHVFIARSYAQGKTLAHLLKRAPQGLDPGQVLEIALQVIEQLCQLHSVSVLHRDIKPANIIVLDCPQGVQATLTDFGLSNDVWRMQSCEDVELTTACYVSPEQSGLIEAPVGEYSDIYSLGAVFFELATGQQLFSGATLDQVVSKHLELQTHSLMVLRPEFPTAFSEMIRRMLQRNPSDRYQSSQSLLEDFRRILGLYQGQKECFVLGTREPRQQLTKPCFLDRREYSEAFGQWLAKTRSGFGGVFSLEGESGSGKSRLLEEWDRLARVQGVAVCRGQALNAEGQQPLQALMGVVSRVVEQAEADPVSLHSLLGGINEEQRDSLIRCFPQTEPLFARKAPFKTLPEVFAVQRGAQAFTALLDALGKSKPTVIFLDDFQWADDLTVRFLEHWKQSGQRSRVSVVLAIRKHEGLASLQSLVDSENRVRLSLLSQPDVRQIAESMAGPLPAEAVDLLSQNSKGNPFYVESLVRGMVGQGFLRWKRGKWVADSSRQEWISVSWNATAVLTESLERCSALQWAFLQIAAILGKRFAIGLAGDALGWDTEQTHSVLSSLTDRHWLWCSGDMAQFSHDMVREAVLAKTVGVNYQQLHLRVAERIERQGTTSSWVLAHHYHEAGAYSRAFPFALEAAREARARSALALAEGQFRIAVKGYSNATINIQHEVHLGLATVLMLLGRYAESEIEFQTALNLSQSDIEKAQTRAFLAELAFKQGKLDKSARLIAVALKGLGLPLPKHLSGYVFGTAYYLLSHFLSGGFAKKGCRPAPLRVEVICRLLNRLCYVVYFSGATAKCIYLHFRALKLAQKYLPSEYFAQTLANQGPISTYLGPAMMRRAVPILGESLAIRQAIGSLWGQGNSLNFLAVTQYTAAHYSESIQAGERAWDILERSGDLWEMHVAGFQVAASHMRLGEAEKALEWCRIVHESSVRTHDEESAGRILDVWARVAPLTVPTKALSDSLQFKCEDTQAFAQIRLGAARVALAHNEIEQAFEHLDSAERKLKGRNNLNAFSVPVFSWLLTTTRLLLRNSSTVTPLARRGLQRRWARLHRKAWRLTLWCVNERPHIYRERAFYFASRGQYRRAWRWAEKSLSEAAIQHAAVEAKETAIFINQLATELGWPLPSAVSCWTQSKVRLPDQIESGPEATSASVSLASLFTQLLKHGRRIAGALSEPEVHDRLWEAGRELLRGDHCVILRLNEEGQLEPVKGDPDPQWSTQIATRALQTQKVVGINLNSLTDLSEALHESQVKAVLCAPILVAGSAYGCIYVSHSQLSEVFSKDISRVILLIAEMAGAAIENATLYQRNLENHRVKDEFIAVVSHELRTPMTIIKGWLDLMVSGALEADKMETPLEAMGRAVDLQIHVINQLIDVSAAATGKLSLNKKPLVLGHCLAQIVDGFQSVAHQKNIRLTFDCDDPSVQVQADEKRIEQAISNLLSNAIKFTPQEGIVQVRCYRSLNEGIRITIQDSGMGVDRAFLPFIFEKFRQEDRKARRKIEGLGLGLAIVKNIVELHGGRVEASSEGKGKGASFTVILPIMAHHNYQRSIYQHNTVLK